MNRRVFILITLLLLYSKLLFSQVDIKLDNLRNYMPPSPNASSIAKYNEWPVSQFTGIPSINIPLYEIKGRSVSVPIGLSYHASGIRVGEVASWVGLGWSLNAGGQITRSVRGLPDDDYFFQSSSNYSKKDDWCSMPIDLNLAILNTVGAAKGEVDSQQDIYSMNVLGRSYSLIISSDGTVYTKPYSKIKIIPPHKNADGLWLITMEDGTQMKLGGVGFEEKSQSDKGSSTNYTSSWMLKEINTIKNEKILFEYQDKSILIIENHITQSDFIEYTISQETFGNPINESVEKGNHYSTSTCYQLLLSKIETDLIRVDFLSNSTPREDMEGALSLGEIKVYSKLRNKYFESYLFNYSYSNCENGNEFDNGLTAYKKSFYYKRLKLNSITKSNPSNISSQSDQKWNFIYNPKSLPSRRSFAQDHWGFYNGKISNATLLPATYFSLPVDGFLFDSSTASVVGFMPPFHVIGADKEPDDNFSTAEILTEIKYPTGGKSTFTFEGNFQFQDKESFKKEQISIANILIAGSSTNMSTKEIVFEITKPQYVQLYFESFISNSIVNDQVHAKNLVQIVDFYTNKIIFGLAENGLKWFNFIRAGKYRIRLISNINLNDLSGNDYSSMNAYIEYEKSLGVVPTKIEYGGLRVKNISYFDPVTNKRTSKFYMYDSVFAINPISPSFYVTSQVVKKVFELPPPMVGVLPTIINVDYVKVSRNASTRFSLGSVQGGTVGYGIVSVTNNSTNGENGKIVTHFSCESDAGDYMSLQFPYPPTDSRDHRRGLVLREEVFNKDNSLIKKVENTYAFERKYIVSNYVAGYGEIVDPKLCVNLYQNCGILKSCFDISTEAVKNITSVSYEYDSRGIPFVNQTNYYYENPLNPNPTKVETFDSKQNRNIVITRTPLDKNLLSANYSLSDEFSTAIDLMVEKNMINSTLQQSQFKNDKLLKQVTIESALFSNNMILSNKILSKTGNNPLELKATISNYDTYGNVLEQYKTNDIKEVTLWSYKGNYPVAKIVGSNLIAVSQLLDVNFLSLSSYDDASLRQIFKTLRLQLPNAQIESYTYDPLIGVTSKTDARGIISYYEYDSFGRLKLIRDFDGNIIKSFDYQYQANQ